MRSLDPDLEALDEAIIFIMKNGITAHCASIGFKKVIDKLVEGFTDSGYVSSVRNNSIILYARQRELGKMTPIAKINLTSRDINFEWNPDETFNPLRIMSVTLKSFYEEFGDLNDMIIELEEEDGIVIGPLICCHDN